MSDDPLTRFTSKHRSKPENLSALQPTLPPAIAHHEVDGRQAYEAYEPFENEVRTTSVELRCNRSGLSYFVQYAHMSPIVFNFRSGGEIFFSGGGYGFTITGRSLRLVVMALRLHTCGTIQDFNPEAHILPEPLDRSAPFVDSIEVEVLRPVKPGQAPGPAREEPSPR